MNNPTGDLPQLPNLKDKLDHNGPEGPYDENYPKYKGFAFGSIG